MDFAFVFARCRASKALFVKITDVTNLVNLAVTGLVDIGLALDMTHLPAPVAFFFRLLSKSSFESREKEEVHPHVKPSLSSRHHVGMAGKVCSESKGTTVVLERSSV